MSLRKKTNLIMFLSILASPIYGIGTNILQGENTSNTNVPVPLIIYILVFSIMGYTVINYKLNPIIKYLDSKQENLKEAARNNVKFIENFFVVFLILYNIMGLFSTFISDNAPPMRHHIVL